MSFPADARHLGPWHLLQVSDVLDLELARAMAEFTPIIAWEPKRTFLPLLTAVGQEPERLHPGSSLRIRELPLLRGYARFPLSALLPTGSSIVRRLERQGEPSVSPLLCTIPHFASVAEQWQGPVVYWLTDLIARYAGANTRQVEALDRRMCRAATLVCPNSNRLAQYLVERAGCHPAKITVVPNATRAANLLSLPPSAPQPLPENDAHTTRPIAGVIGNLAGNMDWCLLEQVVAGTPWLRWLFVGPTTMLIPDKEQARAREALMNSARASFVGKKPYGELAAYARSFDVAILPYLRSEPTYSGSSTRFYEHLAACRPMIATRGFEELLHKTPLLELVDEPEEMIQVLETLRLRDFDDGLQLQRWQSSRTATWEIRARTIHSELVRRLAEGSLPAQQAHLLRAASR